MSKRFLSLVLALVMVLGTLGSAVFAAPSDVAGTEYETAVDRLKQLGVLTGYPDGTFKPENSITRAEFAAAVIRVKGYETIANATKGLATGFKDVPANHWASGYVGTAAKLGLVNGMGDGTFAPEALVTYEQAVTMVIRALGYEEAAKTRGGYPYGHLIVANENGLLDTVKGVQGLPASRGIVAKLLDNSLEIPLMVQKGYGTLTTWVVSGTDGTDKVWLLDELNFKNVTGVVSEINVKKGTVKVGTEVLTVPAGFDYNFYEGLTIKAWFDTANKMVVFGATNAAKYDATEVVTVTVDGEEVTKLKLVSENKTYDLVDGLEAANADYAKVVLNKNGKIAFAKYYNFEFIVVDSIKDDIVYDINNKEEDLEGYTILKDGKTIAIEDIEEGDVLFFDYSQKFALVYNNTVEGKIDRVYDSGFRLGSKVHELATGAQYLDGKALGTLNVAVLDEMNAEGEAVEVFFNHAGKVVLVIGDRGEEVTVTSSYYGMVKGVYKPETVRGKTVYPVDILTNDGNVVEYSLSKEYDVIKFVVDEAVKQHEGKFVKVSLKDGAVNNVELLEGVLNLKTIHEDGFKVTATYAIDTNDKGHRLQSSTLVFYKDAADNNKDKVVKLADAKFTGVSEGTMYVDANGRVQVVVATKLTGEPAAKTQTYTGLVTNVRNLRTGELELTFADGKVLLTEGEADNAGYKHEIVTVKVSEKTGKIVGTVVEVDGEDTTVYVTELGSSLITIGADSINLSGNKIDGYILNSDAVIYDITGSTVKTLRLRDLKANDNIKIYLDAPSEIYVNYVVVTTETPAP